ncbi:MAG: hypothetical protein KatS3mg081_0978 [Gemmatimonadales bacterium]|nr:MAG: hypothetical protein KatS3mg081_0978 [Gemmatimonadales bacterium]
MDLDDLVRQGEALHQELGREHYLTGAGLKAEPEFQAIYRRYGALASEEAVELARSSGSLALYEWVAGLRAAQAAAPLEEKQLAWERETVVRAGERQVPYLSIPSELANAHDREFRLALDRNRAATVAAGLNPIRGERFQREYEAYAALGLSDYPAAISQLSGIDLERLAEEGERFLERTADLYAEVLEQVARKRVGVPISRLERADALWIFRARDYDSAFPGGGLLEAAEQQLSDLGLDLTRDGRIRIDTEERPGKQPRAFCVAARVPDEVYLVLRPRGGYQDYWTFWHELGHALHFASVDPDESFEARWLGDASVTEGFAMLFDHMVGDRGWLSRYVGLGKREIENLSFELGVYDLYGVRRYCAKLIYELSLHRKEGSDLPRRYADLLTEATLFRYFTEDYLVDVDPAFYAARYLRAWQFQATLSRLLVEQYDEDWYRNPEAAEFIVGLMRRGQALPADQLLLSVTGQNLSFDPVVERLETLLS